MKSAADEYWLWAHKWLISIKKLGYIASFYAGPTGNIFFLLSAGKSK